jgi:hypothetical protein
MRLFIQVKSFSFRQFVEKTVLATMKFHADAMLESSNDDCDPR